jgi:PAS domain S-box
MSPAIYERAEFHFYHALALAATYDAAPAGERALHRNALAAHHRHLQEWAENCPENFANRAALISAEIARLEGRDPDAEQLYEQAIRSARQNGSVHNEALADEVAARFYAGRGFEMIGHLYLQEARRSYLRWGADAKVRQLEGLYPQLRTEEPTPGLRDSMEAPVEHLDLATVIKVSQAISSEMVLEKLLDTLMRTAIEHAGAQRALLILSRGDEQRIVAEAKTSGDAVIVHLGDEPVTAVVLPETVLHYVLHTRDSVILDDAATLNPFSEDPYIRQRQARSVLCQPVSNQAKVIGVLYLENNLARRAFAPARVAVLKLLASQAAISLENSRLYHDLAEREAKIRRLVDANIIGIFIWDFDGRILDANEAFLAMLGRRRDDLVAGRLRWTEITPAEWRERDAKIMQEHKKTGRAPPFEKEFARKDGSRVPVLIGSATFEGGTQGVAFVLDLTERKRAEEELRKSRNELEVKVKERTAQLSKANEESQFVNKELEAFAYSVSHDLRAPIRHIAGFTELLQKHADPVLDQKSQGHINMILQAANRMGNLVDDLLAFSRIGRAETLKTTINLEELVKQVVGEIAPDTQGRRICWRIGRLPICDGDPSMLRLVFDNLVSNAVKFTRTRPQAKIEIGSLDDSGDEVVVFIKDNGVGFDMKYKAKLFGVFQRLHSQAAFEGTGIGLATVQRIVHRHGGRVWAEASVNDGATFYVALPKPAKVNP